MRSFAAGLVAPTARALKELAGLAIVSADGPASPAATTGTIPFFKRASTAWSRVSPPGKRVGPPRLMLQTRILGPPRVFLRVMIRSMASMIVESVEFGPEARKA